MGLLERGPQGWHRPLPIAYTSRPALGTDRARRLGPVNTGQGGLGQQRAEEERVLSPGQRPELAAPAWRPCE